MTGCTVDTITLSSQQKSLAEERIKAAGLAGRIRVWLMDYRSFVALTHPTSSQALTIRNSLPDSWKGAFDRVVSIEMLEAVGCASPSALALQPLIISVAAKNTSLDILV